MEIKGKNVLVFGSGVSGIAACKLLLAQQAQVILYDGNTSLDPEALKEKAGEVQVILGDLSKDVMESLALAVLSPGVPTDLPVVEEMKALQIPIWGEVELAYVYGKGDVLAITGTNGKTTTTSLLGEIMKAYKDSVFVVGNIGNPYTDAVLSMTEDSVAVAEMSSLPVGNDPQFCTESQCDLKHHTGSSESPSYDGSIYCGERKHHSESDGGRYLCAEL